MADCSNTRSGTEEDLEARLTRLEAQADRIERKLAEAWPIIERLVRAASRG